MAEGVSVQTATRRVLDEYEESFDDPDDGSLVWLALAALQVEQGTVQQCVRRAALAVIAAGDDLARWEAAGEEAMAERRRGALRPAHAPKAARGAAPCADDDVIARPMVWPRWEVVALRVLLIVGSVSVCLGTAFWTRPHDS